MRLQHPDRTLGNIRKQRSIDQVVKRGAGTKTSEMLRLGPWKHASMLCMENVEVYFRQLDQLSDRENFLEKEMLDADVHHLEVRTGFFDKLAVLAAGSLALGITFLASGYQNDSLRHGIHPILFSFSVAMLLVLFSLIPCVIHNFLISRAVTLLSKQVECTYKAAHAAKEFREHNPGQTQPFMPKEVREEIQRHEKEAELFGSKKEAIVTLATRIGVAAVVSLILGFAIGLSGVVVLFAYTP